MTSGPGSPRGRAGATMEAPAHRSTPLAPRRLRLGGWCGHRTGGRRFHTVAGSSDPARRPLVGSVGPSRVAEWPAGPLARRTHRPGRGATRGCSRRGGGPGTPEEESCGSTRPAPVERSPSRRRAPAARPRPRQRGHHPGSGPRGARGRDAVQRGPVTRRCARSSRSWPCWSARSGPASRRTRAAPRHSAPAQLKRLDGVATILAKTAARDTSLLAAARRGRRRLRLGQGAQARDARGRRRRGRARGGAGRRARPPRPAGARAPRRARSRSSHASSPTPSSCPTSPPPERPRSRRARLASWELLGPLFRSFEYAGGGARRAWPLPEPSSLRAPASSS